MLLRDIKLACGINCDFDKFVGNLETLIAGFSKLSAEDGQRSARVLADHLALAMQGSIMIRYTDSRVSDHIEPIAI
jgi:hypothetical protein